jgi:hypothetical protein
MRAFQANASQKTREKAITTFNSSAQTAVEDLEDTKKNFPDDRESIPS